MENNKKYISLADLIGVVANEKAINVDAIPLDKTIEKIYLEGEGDVDFSDLEMQKAIMVERKIQTLKERKQRFNKILKECEELVVDGHRLKQISYIIDIELDFINTEIGRLI